MNQSISARFSRHAPRTAKTHLRELKRDFAKLFVDEDRFAHLAAKHAIGNITKGEIRELNVLQKLRRWKCDCLDCENL